MPAEKALCRLLVRAVDEGWIVAAHDLSEGGLAVAAAEIAMTGGIGVRIETRTFLFRGRKDALLFGELPGGVLVCFEGDSQALEREAKEAGLGFAEVGEYGPGSELMLEPF